MRLPSGSSLRATLLSAAVAGSFALSVPGCAPAEADRPSAKSQNPDSQGEHAHHGAHSLNAGPTVAQGSSADSFDVRLIDDDDAFRLLIGPVDIPEARGEGHHHHGVLPTPKTLRIPKAVHLTGFSYRVYDGSGRELPTDVLHHMNVIKPQDRELFLPISQRMLALGKETGGQSLPGFLFGHPVKKDTEVVVSAMLHNPVGPALNGVMIEVELDYVDADRPWPLWEIYPFQLDVQFPVGEKAFDLPPGPSEFSYIGRPLLEGRVVALGSHLHDYAQSIQLDDVTNGEQIWKGYPVKDEDGTVTGVTVGRLYKELGKKIHRDHLYRVTVRYDNPTGDTLKRGGMGVIAGAFLPTDMESWPRANSTHPLYRLDRMHYLRQVSGTYDELLARLPADSIDAAVDAEIDGGHDHH